MTVSFHQMSISFLKLALPANYVLPAKEAGTQRNGHVNLAAMGVSAERQRNAVRNAAKNIGLMCEQDDGRFIFDLAQGCVKIVARRVPRWPYKTFELIAKPRDPERPAILRHAHSMVLKDFDIG